MIKRRTPGATPSGFGDWELVILLTFDIGHLRPK